MKDNKVSTFIQYHHEQHETFGIALNSILLTNVESFIGDISLQHVLIDNVQTNKKPKDLHELLSSGSFDYMSEDKQFVIKHRGSIVEMSIGNNGVIYIKVWSCSGKLASEAMAEWKDMMYDPKASEGVDACWWYNSQDCGLNSSRSVEELDDEFYPEAYPFIEDLQNQIKKYIESDEAVLLMRGIPGVGKSRLVRYVLRQFSIANGEKRPSVYFTNDPAVISSEDFYISFMTSKNANVLLLEDIDQLLYSRKEGNSVMPRMLNAADGFLQGRKKKIILTTNIIKEELIDPALIRKGRCFAIWDCRKLTYAESKMLLNKLNPKSELPENRHYTTAEIFQVSKGEKTFRETKQTLGFMNNE